MYDGVNSNSRPVTIRVGNASAGWSRIFDSGDSGYDRHFQAANYLFADGHVAAHDYTEVQCQPSECWWSAQGQH